MTISSLHNDRIKAVRRLRRARERHATGHTILEGPRLLDAALAAGVVPEVVFIAEDDAVPAVDADVIEVTDNVLEAIAPTETPRGPITVIAVPDAAPLVAAPTVVLWEVATPGNVGTLIRTAAAFGWNVTMHGGADPWSPKVLRAGAGAHFLVPISEADGIGALWAAGLTPVATVSTGGVPPAAFETSIPVALLIGNEAHGLPQAVVDACEAALSIPIEGLESLNAAVAGSIAMYELSREA